MMFILALLSVFLVFGMSMSAEVDPNMKKIARVSNALGVNLYRKMNHEEGNICFSPFSIALALAMLQYGTRGQTLEEMKEVLDYTRAGLAEEDIFASFSSLIKHYSQESNHYQLSVASALLADKTFPINEKYKKDITDIFDALVTDADFRDSTVVVNKVNDFVKRMTQNHITKILSQLDPQTVLLILNAVYFKGAWQNPFPPQLTYRSNFFNGGLTSRKVRVPMMGLTTELPYVSLGEISVLELPYAGEEISMFILISRKISGLADLEEEINLNMLRHIRKLMNKTKVALQLPKFKITYEKVLNDALKAMGLHSLFGAHANLTGISEYGDLVVSQVLHKAAIEVNEEGTEASGATAIIIDSRMVDNRVIVIADHPFLFAIVDRRNDLILFQGRISEL